ncbi:hypothetical protein FOXG_18342 [Fusarium oxysporum f. sp. lycopersici 4287]|uniref:Uncharacterized protein n=1 Tax=Fusarium oxysporum f. sp. lycopersici (strain 4287 / CBS 123668 / FGSC 9935 / NRRL 34936) TaxID=426428 RepID=A0A0J9UIX9_FUSO4|nr:hypothetical protein FOXG_18342 [Fusarium oxysporum f. sp. lycopersici 4287]KNA98110.1 hypothetical protein FOXG_18342 [Fusarium oxysporum f. sp. lycopersici 4287]
MSGFQRYEDIGQGGIYTLVNHNENNAWKRNAHPTHFSIMAFWCFGGRGGKAATPNQLDFLNSTV